MKLEGKWASHSKKKKKSLNTKCELRVRNYKDWLSQFEKEPNKNIIINNSVYEFNSILIQVKQGSSQLNDRSEENF